NGRSTSGASAAARAGRDSPSRSGGRMAEEVVMAVRSGRWAGSVDGGTAPAQAPRRIDADRAQEGEIRAVDLEDRFAGAARRSEGERIVARFALAFAIHQEIEGVPLLANSPQRT